MRSQVSRMKKMKYPNKRIKPESLGKSSIPLNANSNIICIVHIKNTLERMLSLCMNLLMNNGGAIIKAGRTVSAVKTIKTLWVEFRENKASLPLIKPNASQKLNTDTAMSFRMRMALINWESSMFFIFIASICLFSMNELFRGKYIKKNIKKQFDFNLFLILNPKNHK